MQPQEGERSSIQLGTWCPCLGWVLVTKLCGRCLTQGLSLESLLGAPEVPSSGCEPGNRVYQPTGCLFFHRLFKSHQHYQRNQVCSWPPGRRVREAPTCCSCAFGGWGNILHEFPQHQTQGDHTVMTYKGKPALQQQLYVRGPVVDVKNIAEETV